MTDINFYVSKEIGFENRLNMIYRLLSKALQRKLQIHIHTDSEESSQAVDEYLWTKEASSFISHQIINADLLDDDNKVKVEPSEITISHNYEPLGQCDYLINLSNQRPDFFSRFSKMAEILDNDENIITAGRKRYSFYRDRGYTLAYYQL